MFNLNDTSNRESEVEAILARARPHIQRVSASAGLSIPDRFSEAEDAMRYVLIARAVYRRSALAREQVIKLEQQVSSVEAEILDALPASNIDDHDHLAWRVMQRGNEFLYCDGGLVYLRRPDGKLGSEWADRYT